MKNGVEIEGKEDKFRKFDHLDKDEYFICFIYIDLSKMNEKQIPPNNVGLLENWKPHPFQSDIFVNVLSNEQVQRHYAQISKGQQIVFQKRTQETHPIIVKVRYFKVIQRKPNSEEKLVEIYTDRMLPINRSHWIPINTALSVLKGFRRLSSLHGFMKVNKKMVSMNEKGQLKIWINENPIFNEISSRAASQEQMLADIIRIIMNYDSQTGGLLVGCKTLNEAINNILVSLAQPKSQQHFSQRTKQGKYSQKNRNDEKNTYFHQSDRYRSKKPEEKWKNTSDPKKINQGDNLKTEPNYLQHVHIAKTPKYLNTLEDIQVPNKLQNDKKFMSPKFNFEQKTSFNYKKNTIQFNNSNPIHKTNNPPKFIHEHNNQTSWKSQERYPKAGYEVMSPISNANTPQIGHYVSYQNFNNHKFIGWKKVPQRQNLNQRKSDLHPEYAPKQVEKGRPSQFPHFIQNRKKIDKKGKNHEERKIENDKEDSLPSTHQKQVKDVPRTRTEDFTNKAILFQNQSWNVFGKNPGMNSNANMGKGEFSFPNKKEKFKEENKQVSRKQLKSSENGENGIEKEVAKQDVLISSSKLITPSYYTSNYGNDSGKFNFERESRQSSKKDSQEKNEQKKVTKQQLAKQIKMQFNCLLSPTQIQANHERQKASETEEKTLLDTKSSKDLLIKQKVEKKKATFAQLKSQAIKILNDPLF